MSSNKKRRSDATEYDNSYSKLVQYNPGPDSDLDINTRDNLSEIFSGKYLMGHCCHCGTITHGSPGEV